MAELINSNVFDVNKKFVDFAGLDYFWEKAKGYIDNGYSDHWSSISKLNSDVGKLESQLEALTIGGTGSIQSQIGAAIDAAIKDLDLAKNYDKKGAADQAELNAKGYAKSYADELNTAMDNRVKGLEAIDHEKLASDASAAAVATILDGAPEKFDTLKEIAEWIASSEESAEAADLVTRVSTLETGVSTLEGEMDSVEDRVKAIEDLKITTTYETKSDATSKLAEAKAYADGLASNYDATGSAAQALADAKTYVDGKVDGKFDATGSAAQALADAKAYADQAEADAIAQAKLDAADALKSYYTKTEVDSLLETNSTADQLYAKTYTDELFNSIKFASRDDIDGLFNVQVPM